MPESLRRPRFDSVAWGALAGLLVHVVGQPLVVLLALPILTDGYSIGLSISLLFLGWSQLPYAIPAVLVARAKGLPSFAKGMAIAAGVLFLATSLCTGFVALTYSGH